MKIPLLFVLFLALLSVACGGLETITPCDGCVDMVQPSGNVSRDTQYAGGVNLPNSQSNLNNKQAEYYGAQAYAIENQIYAVNQQTQLKTGWLFGSGFTFLCFVAFLLCGGLYVFVVTIERLAKRKVNVEQDADTDIVTYKHVGNRFERR